MELNLSIDLPDNATQGWLAQALHAIAETAAINIAKYGVPEIDGEQRGISVIPTEDSSSTPVRAVLYRSA